MTSYLDDTWLQAEMQRFEATKASLQEAAALLNRATAAVPQLQRGLEQLDQHERKTRKSLDQLSSEKKQELARMVTQAQGDFDGHVQEVIRKLSAMGEAGQLLELRQEVMKLLASLPVLEQQAAHLTEELSEVQEQYPALVNGLDRQLSELFTLQTQVSARLDALHSEQGQLQERLHHLTRRDPEVKAALDALHTNQVELQKVQQQLQTYQQSQGATIQRTVQQLSELENSGKRSITEHNAILAALTQQVGEAIERLARLESRQNATEFRLEHLESKLAEQVKSAQAELQARLTTQLTTWQQESQQTQQRVDQRLDQLSEVPPQLERLTTRIKETQTQLEAHHSEASARHDGQREALADLERQVGSVQTRASRFIAWFEKASALTRLRGTPE